MNRTQPTVIGVDLGGTNVRAGRVVQAVIDHAAMSLRDTGDSQSVIDDVCATIERVLTPEVTAIGIGVPSLVDPDLGIVYNVTNIPSWKEVHLKQILEARFHLPVHINNDANCFALGEFHYGLGQGSRHLVGLIIGTGLGAPARSGPFPSRGTPLSTSSADPASCGCTAWMARPSWAAPRPVMLMP